MDLEQRESRGIPELPTRAIVEFATGGSEQDYAVIVLDAIADGGFRVTLGSEGEEGFSLGDILSPKSDRALGRFQSSANPRRVCHGSLQGL